ncbi:hypothetical protein [Persephonella sp.]|uniref:hypothetical protein n=1 Tax=Persephonella sp. TaxID=2060922 RepID=UPI0026077952|nr:hypothetical protein [Persephonella sp.]
MNFREELKKILQTKIEEKLQKDDFASLWLSEVNKAEKTLKVPLGSQRGRDCRPLIVLSKNKKIIKKIIFLTTKGDFLPININNCTKKVCICKNKLFKWENKSKVFRLWGNKIIFLLTTEQLKYIAQPCGFCDKQEIEDIYKQIKKYQRG